MPIVIHSGPHTMRTSHTHTMVLHASRRVCVCVCVCVCVLPRLRQEDS